MLRWPNAAPLQTKHACRQTTSMRRRGPEQPARSQQSRNFVQQHARLGQVLDDLRRRDHIEVLRGKFRVLKFTLKHFKVERPYVLHRVCRNIEAITSPAILTRGEKQVTCAAAD